MIDELARGEPDYDLMTEGLAQATRTQLATLQQRMTELGAVESVAFVEVDAQGLDVYDVTHANGSRTWMILLTNDGKTAMAAMRPTATPAPQ
jgi:hypothetical protein